MNDMPAIAKQIWDMKYRLKTQGGEPVDLTVQDSWRRVAKALSKAEKPDEQARYEAAFYEALSDFKYLPAGRILAGAGTDRDVTLFNCYVMGTIPDTMEGIFTNLKEAALTMQQGGGIGYDFSTIRPKGAPVLGVGADASGPLSFMDVWDSMCRTIMSAGSRRGAMMATLDCDHPDIEAFIEAKRDPARLRMFNLSVLVSDPFMEAVANDAPWDLKFNGKVYKTIQAKALWDKIMQSTYDYAEPGVIFIDRINKRNNLQYVENIRSTNPCVTDDTWVMCTDGAKQVKDLIGKPFEAKVDGKGRFCDGRGFFKTGKKQVGVLSTKEGYSLKLTADHKVLSYNDKPELGVRGKRWVRACDLKAGDLIFLNDHGSKPNWPGLGTEEEGYLLGAVIQDLGRKGWRNWTDMSNDLCSIELKRLMVSFGVTSVSCVKMEDVEKRSSYLAKGFLGGLFDIHGAIIEERDKNIILEIALKDLEIIRAVQRILLRFGIVSTVHEDSRVNGEGSKPEIEGERYLTRKGRDRYPEEHKHKLVISSENLKKFSDIVGVPNNYTRGFNRAHLRSVSNFHSKYSKSEPNLPNDLMFTAVFESFTLIGEQDVYDVSIPGVNCFDANGIMVHNCGEQPLPPYGACLLGSINLARFVSLPFDKGAFLDVNALALTVKSAVRMMDNVVEVSKFPIPAQEEEAKAKRRIGLGVTGLADALAMTGLTYGSDEAVEMTRHWMHQMQRAAYGASIDLAKEKGPFPLFDKGAYMASQTIQELDQDLRDGIAQHGIRNALVTSIAPTGTISLYAGNVSSGIEPIFALSYTRKVLQPDGSRTEEEVSDYALTLFRQIKGNDAPLPDCFVTAQNLAPTDHVKMQAAAQYYIDSSISKTINCPEDISFKDFSEVYAEAYRTGCKGCTTYRPNAVTGSVLTVSDTKKDDKKASEPAGISQPVKSLADLMDRPETLEGATYKFKWPESEHALYITVNDAVIDGKRRPFEIFINSKNTENFGWMSALTRMISAVFRRGGDVSFIAEELKAVFDPRGGHWMRGRYVPSVIAAIGGVIEQHLVSIGFMKGPEGIQQGLHSETKGAMCNACGTPGLIIKEGCQTCVNCGSSKCG